MKLDQRMAMLILESFDDVLEQHGSIDRIPCGCYRCSHGVQAGHHTCSQPPAVLLLLEELGVFTRVYDDGAWKWVLIE